MNNQLYIDYGTWIRQQFPFRVQKIAVDAGFTCPNRDGLVGTGGCTFCNNQTFNPSYCDHKKSVSQQLEEGKQFFARKYPDMKYLAYFQAFSNTYAPLPHLRQLYEEALAVEDVVGLVIGTRPDCLPDSLLDYLEELNQHTFLIVEIGIESANNQTLQRINRGHTFECSRDAIERTHARGILTCGHVILGLPGETKDDMMATVDEIAKLPVNSIKFHQMQVLQGTELARQWERGELKLIDWTAQEYAAFCHRVFEHLPPNITIERMVSMAPPNLLLHPHWGLKPAQFKALFDDLY